MTDTIKQYIEDNIKSIDSGDIVTVIKNAPQRIRKELLEVLQSCDIFDINMYKNSMEQFENDVSKNMEMFISTQPNILPIKIHVEYDYDVFEAYISYTSLNKYSPVKNDAIIYELDGSNISCRKIIDGKSYLLYQSICYLRPVSLGDIITDPVAASSTCVKEFQKTIFDCIKRSEDVIKETITTFNSVKEFTENLTKELKRECDKHNFMVDITHKSLNSLEFELKIKLLSNKKVITHLINKWAMRNPLDVIIKNLMEKINSRYGIDPATQVKKLNFGDIKKLLWNKFRIDCWFNYTNNYGSTTTYKLQGGIPPHLENNTKELDKMKQELTKIGFNVKEIRCNPSQTARGSILTLYIRVYNQ